jgi:hypothetical protein
MEVEGMYHPNRTPTVILIHMTVDRRHRHLEEPVDLDAGDPRHRPRLLQEDIKD